MGKKAEEYLKSRQASLNDRHVKHTTVAGLDETTLLEQRRKQTLHEEQTGFISRGYVPVAVDFANIAEQCGCGRSVDSEFTYWVPAWFEAVWRAFTVKGKSASAMGTPTLEFKEYVSDLQHRRPREVYLLVAEMLLEVPYRQELTRAGVEAWLRLHG